MDRNNIEGHSPCANFNYLHFIPIIYITIIWTNSTMRSTMIKDIRGQEMTRNTKRWCHVCHDLMIFFKTLFTIYFKWMPSLKFKNLSVITGIQLINHASRACKIANHAWRYDVPSRITRLIWSQSRITLLILGRSRVTQKPLLALTCGWVREVPRTKINNSKKEAIKFYGYKQILSYWNTLSLILSGHHPKEETSNTTWGIEVFRKIESTD